MNGRGQPHGFFFLLPFPLLTKPRNPLPEVKPSLQQGSFWRLFTLNIFWPAEIGGRGRPPAPPGPAPPALGRDRRGRVKGGNLFTALAPPLTAGQGRKPLPSLLGDPVLRGQSPSRRSAENFTKAQLLPRNQPAGFSPVPAGSGCCRGRRALREDGEARKEADRESGSGRAGLGLSHGEAGTEPKLFREV